MSAKDQLDLFGARELAPRAPKATDLPERDTLEALAARLPKHVRFGTSSFTFEGWKGLVYHAPYKSKKAFTEQALGEYARYPLFRTVGIDRSYYRPMTREALAGYSAQLPDDFRALMKVWNGVTTATFPNHPSHGTRAGKANPYFLDPGYFRAMQHEAVEAAFAKHLGVYLVEIAPTHGKLAPRDFLDALDAFLDGAPAGFRFAIELRDRRLITDDYFATLRRYGASHTFNHWREMPPIEAQRAAAGGFSGELAVTRLMLPPGGDFDRLKQRYAPFDQLVDPDERMREAVIDLIDATADLGLETYVIVNNKAEGSSPLTVRALAEILADRAG